MRSRPSVNSLEFRNISEYWNLCLYSFSAQNSILHNIPIFKVKVAKKNKKGYRNGIPEIFIYLGV